LPSTQRCTGAFYRGKLQSGARRHRALSVTGGCAAGQTIILHPHHFLESTMKKIIAVLVSGLFAAGIATAQTPPAPAAAPVAPAKAAPAATPAPEAKPADAAKPEAKTKTKHKRKRKPKADAAPADAAKPAAAPAPAPAPAAK
jgi:outer membrane biosynthesis protein TonB